MYNACIHDKSISIIVRTCTLCALYTLYACNAMHVMHACNAQYTYMIVRKIHTKQFYGETYLHAISTLRIRYFGYLPKP